MGYCIIILPTPLGACPDLPAFSGGSISYDFEFFTDIGGHPYGTVATYECDIGTLVGNRRRTCENGVWSGIIPSCGGKPGYNSLSVFWHLWHLIFIINLEVRVMFGFATLSL